MAETIGLNRTRYAAPGDNSHYLTNRAPLVGSPLVPLPFGSVEPRGWLLTQLRLSADGLTGHLPELDDAVGPSSGWLGGDGENWERGPYYFRGLTGLAYVLRDESLINSAMKWIGWIFASQHDDGYIGPASAKEKMDWWPNMVALDALRDHYSATSDARVVDCMRRYFRYQASHIEGVPLHSWAHNRGGENTDSVLWLYNLTGDVSLLRLARVLKAQTRDYVSDYREGRSPHPTDHVVNHAMGYKQPGVWFQVSHDLSHLDALHRGVAETDRLHGRVDGMFNADEQMHGLHAWAGTELCAMVEMILSCARLIAITGEASWADRAERVALNSLAGCLMPDVRGFTYYQQQNQINCVRGDHGFITNHGDDLAYGPLTGFCCCRSNMHMGWPKYAAHAWMATADNGLAAVLYAPSAVTARVAGGAKVRIVEETDYPFGEEVTLRVSADSPVAFPLALRIPAWCEGAAVVVNGEPAGRPEPGGFAVIRREWVDGDTVELRLPMPARVVAAPSGHASVSMGPLAFAHNPAETWRPVGGPQRWPQYHVTTDSPWNYGLLESEWGRDLPVQRRPVPAQPFVGADAPVTVTVRARRVPGWGMSGVADGLSAADPPLRALSPNAVEELRLVPFGAARLRISLFPTVED